MLSQNQCDRNKTTPVSSRSIRKACVVKSQPISPADNDVEAEKTTKARLYSMRAFPLTTS